MYEADNSKNIPHYPGKIWMKSNQSNIAGVWVDDTPANRSAVQSIELQAAMSTSSPLREHATLAAFDASHPEGRTMQALAQWLTLHQVPSREAIAIDIEAQAEGKPFQAMTFPPTMKSKTFPPPMGDSDEDEEGMTFRPGMAEGEQPTQKVEDDMEDDPRVRKARPMANEDLDHMSISGGASLDDLQDAGLVHAAMSEAAFDARLTRLKMGRPDKWRLTAAAYERGWFKGQTAGAVSVPFSAPSSANGDTLSVRTDDSPLAGHLKPGRVVNLQGRVDTDRAATLRALSVDVDLLQARTGGKERTC